MRKARSERGRIEARPYPPESRGSVGLHRLGSEDDRDGLLYVPTSYEPDRPAPLAVMLHGAGGNARHGISYLYDSAEISSLIVLAPQSRGHSWDLILGEYGPDIALLDALLDATFSRYAIDPGHVAIGGFSDGASYALSLGLINGDLFSHIIAFAPGFMAPTEQNGTPHIFVSHGTQDSVLPVDRCSRRIVPQLHRIGYEVTYHEFEGGHAVPSDMAQAAASWYLGR